LIYDCILYSGEKDLLTIRLNETCLCSDWVTTVIVEATKTFTGLGKPLYFEQHKEEFKNFNIFYYVVDNMPMNCDTWTREKHQRNAINIPLLFCNPKDDDIIIISDIDEVPRAKQVNKFKPDINFAALIQDKYSYFLNCFEGRQTWDRARIMTWEYLKDKSPEEVRNSGYDFSIHDAGFHWSWLGGVDEMVRKLESFSHQEHNTPELNNAEVLKHKLETGQCLWNNNEGDTWKFIDIDLSHPEYLFKNKEKFKHLIK